MNRKQRPHPLIRALQVKLSDAVIAVTRQKPWYSMTFAGERLEFCISLSGVDAKVRMQIVADHLPSDEFSLPRMLVAEIVVTHMVADSQSATLSVEALILEE